MYDSHTWSTEAVGYRDNNADEIVERQANTWFEEKDDTAWEGFVRYLPYISPAFQRQLRDVARAQEHKRYAVATSKTDDHWFYCSKLAWFAYARTTGASIDRDWGFWVFPDDIEASNVLKTAYRWERR